MANISMDLSVYMIAAAHRESFRVDKKKTEETCYQCISVCVSVCVFLEWNCNLSSEIYKTTTETFQGINNMWHSQNDMKV